MGKVTPIGGDWGTEDPSYSPDRFYVHATDGKGNSNEIRTKVPPTVAAQIESIIQQRLVPDYRTAADLVRDAVIHRLRYLNENVIDSPAMKRRVQAEIHGAELARLSMEMDRSQEQVDSCRAHLGNVEKKGNPERLKEAVGHAEDVADGMEEPFKSELEKVIGEYR